jgi:hypothetical protein
MPDEDPKSEVRNPKQAQMTKIQNSKRARPALRFDHWDFGFVSGFGFRISDFLIILG